MSLLRTPKYSREEIEHFFGPRSSGRAAQELFNTDANKYREVRSEAELLGLVGPQREHVWASNMRAKAEREAPRQYSDAELLARAAFSENDCRELLQRTANENNGNNLGKIQAEGRYEVFRAACVSYGLLSPRSAQPEQQPKTLTAELQEKYSDAHHIAISDSLATSLRLPKGTKVPPERLSALIELSGSIQSARDEAEKAAEVKAAESEEN